MPCIREYEIFSDHQYLKRTLWVTPVDDPSDVRYNLHVLLYPKKSEPTITWYAGNGTHSFDESKVLGTLKSTYTAHPIEIVLGDPDFIDSKRMTMNIRSMWMDSTYHLPVKVSEAEGSEKEGSEKEGSEKEGSEKEGSEKEGSEKEGSEKEVLLRWKPTKDRTKEASTVLTGPSFKLVDKADNRVLAKYYNSPGSHDITGTIESWEDLGIENWEVLAMMSLLSLADLEMRYTHKARYLGRPTVGYG